MRVAAGATPSFRSSPEMAERSPATVRHATPSFAPDTSGSAQPLAVGHEECQAQGLRGSRPFAGRRSAKGFRFAETGDRRSPWRRPQASEGPCLKAFSGAETKNKTLCALGDL